MSAYPSQRSRTDGRSGGWWGWKDEKLWLEALFARGDLMVARRERFQRVYDLAERSKSYGDRMEYLKMPVHYVETFIALMTLITALALLWRGVMLIVAPHRLEGRHA